MNKIKVDLYDEEIIRKGIDSIIDFYRTLAIDEHQFAESSAFATGVDSPFMNVLFDFRLDKSNSKDLVEKATTFFKQHRSPWGWFITPAFSANDLIEHGFLLLEETPAMYFDLSNGIPDMKSEFITVHELDQDDDMTKWIQPISEGFGIKGGDDRYRKLNVDILNKGDKKLKHYIAYYKGNLAAAGTLFLSNDSVMIHNIATKKDFKKCGLATTLTLHMMEVAKKMGFRHCFLDSSDVAFNLYKKIGFRVYSTTLIYCKA
jgi:predicted GNAT family acetyltransferase